MEIKGLILNHISNFIFKQNKIHTEYLFYLEKKKEKIPQPYLNKGFLISLHFLPYCYTDLKIKFLL